jgi:hypothetical protein
MSFIGGIIQSILSDAIIKAITKKRSTAEGCGCAVLILLVFIGCLFFVGFLINLGSSNSSGGVTDNNVWKAARAGDSVFVRETYGIKFYKKGMVKLNSWEQREVKYAYDKKMKFIDINDVDDRFFFKNKTSFIGICLGRDSLTDGGKWIMIKPSNAVTHPPRPKDEYDFETRRWDKKNYDLLNETKLSKDFYVRVSDVTHINNNHKFK